MTDTEAVRLCAVKKCGCVRYWCWRCAGKWNNRRIVAKAQAAK